MHFQEAPKSGTVMGNQVVAKPVPFARLRSVQAAGADGDSLAVIDAMCGVIAEYITLEDGSPIDTADLSTEAIQKLYMFATSMDASGGTADFT